MLKNLKMKRLSLMAFPFLFIAGVFWPVVAAFSSDVHKDVAIGKTTGAAITDYIHQQAQASRLPGVALGVVQGDQVTLLQSFGNVSSDTPFFLASLSKSFTALAVMQLVDQGTIELDKPVISYLPEFRIGNGSESQYMTVRQLLNQNSGVSTRAGLASLFFKPETDLTQALHVFEQYPLSASPGQQFEYSNANYQIAGYIVQRVSGQTYADYIQQHIFDPLEMRNSRAGSGAANIPPVTSGYLNYFGLKVPYQNADKMPEAVVPSGAIVSSADDMTHYLIAQMNDGVYHGKRIVSSESLRVMHTSSVQVNAAEAVPDAAAYGMGWGIGTLNGLEIVSHDGQLNDFQTNMAILPQEKIAIVMLINEFSPLLDESQTYEGMMQGITTGAFPPISHAFAVYYAVFDTIVVASLVLMIVCLYRLRRWPARFAGNAKRRGLWFPGSVSIGIDLLMATLLALGLTYGLGAMFQIIPFTPSLLMGSVPDMSLWIFAIIGFFLIRGLAKIIFVVRYRKMALEGY